MFELKLNDKTIKLKWGTWSMREFCVSNNVTIDQYFEILGKAQLDIDLIVKLVYIGYKSACISNKEQIEYNEIDVCDWIDEIGSIFTVEGQMVDYFRYIVSTTVTTVQGSPKAEKKKSK
jgi:hypothetical protein